MQSSRWRRPGACLLALTLLIWLMWRGAPNEPAGLGAALAQDHGATEKQAVRKPFVKVPDTISPEARKFLESLPDPSAGPPFPAPDDVAGWKRVWEANEAAHEPLVKATLKRFEPSVTARKLGGVPVLDIKPKDWQDNRK